MHDRLDAKRDVDSGIVFVRGDDRWRHGLITFGKRVPGNRARIALLPSKQVIADAALVRIAAAVLSARDDTANVCPA